MSNQSHQTISGVHAGEGARLFVGSNTTNNYSDNSDLLDRLPYAPTALYNSGTRERQDKGDEVCYEGTRVDILETIERWLESDDEHRIFWLSGWAGSGKSAIARTIAQQCEKSNRWMATFFFRQDDESTSTTEKFVGTLARQLAGQNARYKAALQEALSTDLTVLDRALRSQWEKLIASPIARLAKDGDQIPLTLVIDALDECSPSEIHLMSQIFGVRKSNDSIPTRILITGRPETRIRDEMAALGVPDTHRRSLQDESDTERDIRTFMQVKLARIPLEDRDITLDELCRKASRLFIWASTACRQLLSTNPRSLVSVVVKRLLSTAANNPEKNLDTLYLEILRGAIGESEEEQALLDFCKQLRYVLGSIVTLQEPLPASSLDILLDIGINGANGALGTSAVLDDLHSIVDLPDEHKRPLRLHHPSFRDFLVNNSRCEDDRVVINESTAHFELAQSCLQLLGKTLRPDICQVHKPGTTTATVDLREVEKYIPMEVQYACLYWVAHLGLGVSSHRPMDAGMVLEFLKKHFLHWLEALAWMRRLSSGVESIRELQSLVGKDTAEELHKFAHDAWRYARYGLSLTESTPLQIYASVLAFSPTNSLVRKSYNEYYPDHPGWVIHKQSSTNWGGIVQTITCQYSYDVSTIAIAKCGHLAIFVDGFVSGEPLSISIYNVLFGNLLQKVSIPSGDLHIHLICDRKNMYSLSPDGSHLGFLLDSGDICTWNLTTESMKIVPSTIQDSELGDISTGSEGLEKSRIRWMDIIDVGGFWLALGFSDTQGHLVDLIDGEYIIELEAAHALSVTLATCQENRQGDYVVVAVLNDQNPQSNSGHSILVETWSKPDQRVFGRQIPLDLFGELFTPHFYMAISPDGTRLAVSVIADRTGPSDSRTVIYDLEDLNRSIYCKNSGSGRISWSPDSAILAVHAGNHRPEVAFYESNSGDLRAVSPNKFSHMGCFSPDGMYYVFGTNFETVIEDCTSIFSSKPEHEPGQQKGVDQTELITISSDGKLAGVSYEYGKKYVLYDIATASEMSTTKPGRAGPALDQNKGTLERDGLSLQYNSTGLRHFDERTYFDLEAPVKVYGKEEAARISKQRGQGWALQSVSFSLETQLIKFVDGSGRAPADFLLYHREVGCVELELGAPPNNIRPNWWTEWTFSPDGNLLAAHAIYNAHYPDDTLVGLWCTKTGRNFCLENVPDTRKKAWIAFSHDGQTLFTNEATFTIERKGPARQEIMGLTTKNQLGLSGWSELWVCWEGERILWLPPEYRENAMIGRTKPGVYVIGLVHENTGNVSFLHFYPEKMLFS